MASKKGKAALGCGASARGVHGQGQPTPGLVGGCPGNHADAVDDRAHAETQGAARAAVSNRGQVGFRIKLDSLQAGINIIDGTCRKGQNCSHPSVCASCAATLGDISVWFCTAAIATAPLAGNKNNPSPDTEIREVGQITPRQKLTGHRGWLQKEEFAPWYLNSQRVFLLDVNEVFAKAAVCWRYWFRGDTRPHLHTFSTMPITRHFLTFILSTAWTI